MGLMTILGVSESLGVSTPTEKWVENYVPEKFEPKIGQNPKIVSTRQDTPYLVHLSRIFGNRLEAISDALEYQIWAEIRRKIARARAHNDADARARNCTFFDNFSNNLFLEKKFSVHAPKYTIYGAS
jgi:hypothetical protein